MLNIIAVKQLHIMQIIFFNKMNKSSISLLFKHYQHISMLKNATSITKILTLQCAGVLSWVESGNRQKILWILNRYAKCRTSRSSLWHLPHANMYDVDDDDRKSTTTTFDRCVFISYLIWFLFGIKVANVS